MSIAGCHIVVNSVAAHSARRLRTLSGRHLSQYESIPDVLIRRGQRKDVSPTSRSSQTYELHSPDAGTLKDVRKTLTWAQSRSFSQRNVGIRHSVDDSCRVGAAIETKM